MAKQAWNGQTGGTHGMQRALVWWIRHLGLSAGYNITHIWHIWYIFTRPEARKGAYRYHRRRGRSRWQAAFDVYRSFYRMGVMLIDRFAVYGGYQFDVTVEHEERYNKQLEHSEGFVLMFSHIGNSEMAAYTMSTRRRMHVLVYGGESGVVMEQRARVLEQNNIGMITVQPNDMSHIFAINEVLQRGEVLAVAGDRRWGDKTIDCTVLGATAPLPAGVFQLCATLRCAIVLPFVFKEQGNRYRITVEEIRVNEALPRNERAADLAQQFADLLTKYTQAHPYDWFNFFDFWNEEKR